MTTILCSKCDGSLLPVDVADNAVLADYGEDIVFECTPIPDLSTARQKRALHKYFDMVALALNDAGYFMEIGIVGSAKKIEIPWTGKAVKEYIWRPIQVALIDEKSTTKLDTSQPGEVYTNMSRYLSERLCINVPWPSLR